VTARGRNGGVATSRASTVPVRHATRAGRPPSPGDRPGRRRLDPVSDDGRGDGGRP